MKNKRYLKYVNLSILSILFILPLAAALEQSFQTTSNITTQLNITGNNQSFIITTESGTFNYNLTNSTNTTTINLQRNVTCTYNVSDVNTNVSSLYFVLQNISDSASKIAKAGADRAAYFDQYTNCLANLSSAMTNLSIQGAKQDFQTQYQTCITEKTGIQGSLTTLQTQLGQAPSQGNAGYGCLKDADDCKQLQGSVHNWYIGLFIAGLAIGYFLCYNFKVKPKTGPDSLHNQPSRYE